MEGILFGVVADINEYAGVEAPGNPVEALNNNSTKVSLNELIIQEGLPLLVKHLTMAMGLEGS